MATTYTHTNIDVYHAYYLHVRVLHREREKVCTSKCSSNNKQLNARFTKDALACSASSMIHASSPRGRSKQQGGWFDGPWRCGIHRHANILFVIK